MIRFLLVCLGGAVGTGARYLLGGWVAQLAGPAFPVGTLAINVIGSFAIGIVAAVGLSGGIGPDARVILSVGVLGGFTTYSSFNYETLAFAQRGAWSLALAYVAATFLGCLGAGVLGIFAARALTGSG